MLLQAFCGILLLICVETARILGVFPMPFLSHQSVFRALTMELARRGHELVVITTAPMLSKNRTEDNVTEIDMSYSFQILERISSKIPFKRGIVIDPEAAFSYDMNQYFVDIYSSQLDHPDVKKLIEDRNQHFDLILLEAAFFIHLIFTNIFKAPAILISSFHGFPESFELVGTIGWHPIYYPNFMRQIYGGSSIIEKLRETKLEFRYIATMKESEEYENQMLREKFGPNTPTIRELKNNVDMFFVNLNQVFQDNRPVPPNVVYVGPLHMQPVKNLPEDLQSFLDHSTTGVIYVSMGTIVHPSNMDEEMIDAFLDAFEVLPYDLLWKFDADSLKRLPKNVKVQKWFPQRDLLAHHNIKLFVTQGGLQSTEEAIDATVPMVAIPIIADQYYNAYKFEQLGIGIRLDILTLDSTVLVDGINKVLRNDSYKANIKKVKEIIDDQIQTPLERAVWWTEYVIRHKGAKHLRSPAANVSWAEYLMMDVLLFLLSILLLVAVLLGLMLKCTINTYKRLRQKKRDKLQ